MYLRYIIKFLNSQLDVTLINITKIASSFEIIDDVSKQNGA